MPYRLQAARYPGVTYAGVDASEIFDNISELKFRWSLPGGVQRIELTIPANSGLDAYDRYDNHLGDRIAIFDNLIEKPIVSGQIFEIVPDGRHVTYVCAGPWKRTYDDYYTPGDFPGTGDTDAIIKDILTDGDPSSVFSSDHSNISGSSVAIGGWSPKIPGSDVGEAIKELAAVGDSADNPMDFYFVEQLFSGTQMQAPLPYLKSRSTTASPDWIFSTEDLASNGLTLARHIWDLNTHIKIGYGRLSGAHDGGAGSNTLIDGSEDYITDGVRPGDRVINITDTAVFEVAAVTNLTTLTFTDNASASWDNGDIYSIKLRVPKWTAWNSPTTSDYWVNVHTEQRMEMDQTQAEQYRDQLYALYNDAQLQQAFVIGSPTIQDGNTAKWPLWRVFSGDSFYFRINDLFPEAAIFSDSDNRKSTFMAVAMDYTYSDNRLRIVPSTGDSRLDAMLGQAGIIQGQIVATETAWRVAKREREQMERAARQALRPPRPAPPPREPGGPPVPGR